MDHDSLVLARVGPWPRRHESLRPGRLPVRRRGFATAGILTHLPALLALGGPGPASYLRLVASHWAGVFACWGVETRETGPRYVPGTAGLAGAANLEVECFDLAANP